MECPKVSVIIPVYNVENYLRQCLDSVCNQTLREIEIICVDDGSTDRSPEILREYQETDPRVTVISQKKAGPSVARNRGLEHARGTYVQFLDSDDYLREDALEKLYGTATEKELDALLFDFERFYDADEGGKTPNQFVRKEYSQVCDGVSFLRMLKDENAYTTSACIILLRREFLKDSGLAFYNGILHEDELFCFQVLMQARRVSHMGQPFYRRRLRAGSIVTAPKTHENVMGCFICMQEVLRYGLSLKDDEARMFEALRAFAYLQRSSRAYYMQISPEEQRRVRFENPFSQILFDTLIASFTLQGDRLSQAEREMRAIRSSVSYQIGRGITWLPRKVRGGIRCFRENGLKYTVRRALEHLRRKHR